MSKKYDQLYGDRRKVRFKPKLKPEITEDLKNTIKFYTKDIFTESWTVGYKITLQINNKWKYFGPYNNLEEAKIKCYELKLQYGLDVPELMEI